MLARTLEKAGFSTVLVTNMPFWAEKSGVPRTLAVEFPFGHTLGQPHEREQQMQVIGQALALLESAGKPGAVAHSTETWPVPIEQAIRDWQPAEPSPVVRVLGAQIRQIVRERKTRAE